MILALCEHIQAKYGKTFFDGKLVREPPVRGPYAEAEHCLNP